MTPEQEEFIRSRWDGMSAEEIRRQFNLEYGTQYKTTAFHYHTNRMGLSKWTPTYYTEEQDAFLRDNSGRMTRQELVDAFNEKFRTTIKLDAINQRCHLKGWKGQSDGQFKTGGNPWDKTIGGRAEYVKTLKGGNSHSFKKGQIAHNAKRVGTVSLWGHNVRIRTEHGWDNRLRWLWRRNYGDIPDGYVITSVDGDPYTDDPENLRAIPNRTLTTLMSNRWHGKGTVIVDTGIAYCKLKEALEEVTNEGRFDRQTGGDSMGKN